jgi:glycerophosphoryl diester phosphodiesterase
LIMTKTITVFIGILGCLVVTSCEKINYYPDKDYKEVETLVLAHHGGGTCPFQDNSIEAAIYGLTYMDGIEVDVQLSKDRTVWLSHDADLPDCGGVIYDCFPVTHDYEIVALDSCNGNSLNYTRLEDVFAYMAKHYPDKYISIDVKAWSPCKITSLDITGLMNVIAEEVIKLTDKYKLQDHVMIESETATVLNFVQKHSDGIGTYLTAFGDFERGMLLTLESGYNGISFKYKFDEAIGIKEIQLIRKKGLKIQLWTVDSEEDIKEALSINPDFIQTDNVDYFK